MFNNGCRRFDEVETRLAAGNLTPAESEAWNNHAEQCPTCQVQWTAHRQLTAAFADAPRPQLSAGFEARLAWQLRAQPARLPLRSGGKFLMGLYWAATVAASAAIILASDLPRPDLSGLGFRAVVLAAVPLSFLLVLMPREVLRRALRLVRPLLT